jgi:phage terminase large subunit-like protein
VEISAEAPPAVQSAALDPATAYAEAVCAGTSAAGPHVRAACRRHLEDLIHAPGRGYTWRPDRAERAFGFFREILQLNAGQFEGMPFILSPWQAFVVGSIFGWFDAEGCRRFQVAYMEAGKGNGKSPMAAGIGLYMMIADLEARAEIYAAASKRDQAMVLFRDAVAMVDQSPMLSEVVHRAGGNNPWNLAYEGSFFRPIASDDGQSGPRPHCALVDELHEHRDGVVLEMLRAGFKFRRSPLMFITTNSGFDRNSVCWLYHDKAVKVSHGTQQDDQFFAYVCALDEGDDPMTDEGCWIKTNPNLGISIRLPYVRGQVSEAKMMPAKESSVRRLQFCEWVDADSPWISGDAWRAIEVDRPADLMAWLSPDRQPLTLAVDLSVTTDLSALAIAAEVRGQVRAAVEFWTPADTLRTRAERDGVDYPLWVKQGHLQAVPGSSLDYGPIATRIGALAQQRHVSRVVFDRYKMAYLKTAMAERGIGLELVEHPQTFVKPKGGWLWMPESINQLEAAVLHQTLRVAHNPALTFAAASAVSVQDEQGNRSFSKRKSTGRIDGLVALTMGVGALRTPQPALDVESWIA